MSVVQLTLHNGRRVGIPSVCAILIFNMENAPDPEKPDAKTMVRYTVDGQTARHALVRDTYKQCLSSFPLAFGGQAWAHITDTKGNDQVIGHKSAAAYEETGDDEFSVIFAVPTGPIELTLRATVKEVEDLLRPEPPVPEVKPEVKPEKKTPAKKPVGKSKSQQKSPSAPSTP